MGSAGDSMVATHTGISAQTDVFTYTSATPLSITISESGSILGTAAGSSSNYMVFQMFVGSQTSSRGGPLATETFTIQYDEI